LSQTWKQAAGLATAIDHRSRRDDRDRIADRLSPAAQRPIEGREGVGTSARCEMQGVGQIEPPIEPGERPGDGRAVLDLDPGQAD
jgi:hypothetical protein